MNKAPPYLTSELDESQWFTSQPGRLTLEERASDAHLIGGWVAIRTILDTVEKKEINIFPLP
jgi:hypothetical protein